MLWEKDRYYPPTKKKSKNTRPSVSGFRAVFRKQAKGREEKAVKQRLLAAFRSVVNLTYKTTKIIGFLRSPGDEPRGDPTPRGLNSLDGRKKNADFLKKKWKIGQNSVKKWQKNLTNAFKCGIILVVKREAEGIPAKV